MTDTPILETQRLILRRPAGDDFAGFRDFMADPVSAEFVGGPMVAPLTWRAMCSFIGHWEVRGYGFFSVIEKRSGAWVGRVGPWYPLGWPEPEVGWGIARPYWGKGYGPEAAAACLDHVFDTLGWDVVTHMIDPKNANSKAVATKLGSADTGRSHVIEGMGFTVDEWAQSREDWAQNRKRFKDALIA